MSLTPDDHERLTAAADKRRRKIERYTDTPAAREAVVHMEQRHSEGTSIPAPSVYPEDPS